MPRNLSTGPPLFYLRFIIVLSPGGDYDNDGDLDILITGNTDTSRIAKIYRNLGYNTFTEQTGIKLPGVDNGSVDWGDYDNDGYLDILLTGDTGSGYISKIYKNNDNNTFTEQTQISLTGIVGGSAAWGDADNDGYLDILLTGDASSSEGISKIYKNNGDNTFTEQTQISLTGVYWSSGVWGDYDNDGDLDILLTGQTGISKNPKIYKNYGDFIFVEQTGISLAPLAGSVAWGDYDNDGYLDILLTGPFGDNYQSIIYKNNGDNTFTEEIGLYGASGPVAWGDYNNDGELDVLLTGYWTIGIYSRGATSILYQNDGDNTFSNSGISLTEVQNASIAWGDYDNDGDLDILLTGLNDDPEEHPVSKVYQNMSSTANTVPAAPSGLSAATTFHPLTGTSKTDLSWNKASDNETSQDGLTYNAYIYREGGDTSWSSMANIHTGYRKIPDMGNVQHDTAWTIYVLGPSKYCWSVQAIDNAFAGSPFAEEDTFLIAISPPEASDQAACSGENVPDLEASGENIKWYSDEELLNEVHSGSPFSTGETDPGIFTWYVTQTINEYESEPVKVTLTIYESPVAEILDSTNILCAGQAEGIAIVTPSGGTPPYSFLWDDDLGTIDSTVTGLEADRYFHVVVTDSNFCSATDSIMLSEPDTLFTEITDWTNISEPGESDGTATVTPSGGTPPYSYLWDDLSSTADSTVTALSPNTWYHVTVTDANGCIATDSLFLTEPGVLRIEITDSTNVSCYGMSDGSATVTVWEGNQPISYLWDDDPGTTTATVENLAPGICYHVVVTDGDMQSATDSILLTEPDSLMVDKDFSAFVCSGVQDGYIHLDVSGGTSPYVYAWNTVGDGPVLYGLGEGEYRVTVTDANGCQLKDTTQIESIVAGQGVEICMVTVVNDNNNWRNLIVWEKNQDVGIAYYNVYRVQAIDTVLLGSVHHDSLSVMLDKSSEPEFQSSIYLMSTTDVCGNESGFSKRHKTIHFRANPRLTRGVDLSWTPYDGFPVTYYEIYRGSDRYDLSYFGLSNPDILSKTDPDPPDGLIYYQVAAIRDEACFPSAGNKKTDTGPYNNSMSNIDDNGITEIFDEPGSQEENLKIFPNPFSQSARIMFPNLYGRLFTLTITDISGKICRIEYGLTSSEFVLFKDDLKEGFYFIEVKGSAIYRGKIIVK